MIKSFKFLILIAALGFIAMFRSSPAKADTITLNTSTLGIGITSTGQGQGSPEAVTLTFGACVSPVSSGCQSVSSQVCYVTGSATLDKNGQQIGGIYRLQTASSVGPVKITAGPNNDGIFPIAFGSFDSSAFTFTGSGGLTLSGPLTYGPLNQNRLNPEFSGTWNEDGQSLPFNFTMASLCGSPIPCRITLPFIAGSAAGFGRVEPIQSGTFDAPSPTPEPGSLGLLGTGLILMGLVLRRRSALGR